MEAAVTGGLLQSQVPPHGYVYWTMITTKFTVTTEALIFTSAFLLVASGIKNLKL